jgi:hypothetical protein
MPTHIDINGFEVKLFEKMYNYVCSADFSNYADEEVDFVGAVNDNELPETIVIDGVEYTHVNFGEDEIGYLKTEALDEPVYTLIYRTVLIANGVYLYIHSTQKSLRPKRKHKHLLTN